MIVPKQDRESHLSQGVNIYLINKILIPHAYKILHIDDVTQVMKNAQYR
jgi:hypothetical protein